jgi:hypothetical protein
VICCFLANHERCTKSVYLRLPRGVTANRSLKCSDHRTNCSSWLVSSLSVLSLTDIPACARLPECFHMISKRLSASLDRKLKRVLKQTITIKKIHQVSLSKSQKNRHRSNKIFRKATCCIISLYVVLYAAEEPSIPQYTDTFIKNAT